MKKILKSLVLIAMIGTVGRHASAQQYPRPAFSGGNTTGTTIASVIIPAFSGVAGTPVVTYLNGTSDKASSKFQLWQSAAPTSASFTNSTVSLPVNSTNGFVSGDVIIIQHVLSDTYERRILTTFTSSTNLTVTAAPTTTTVPGDLIYDLGSVCALCIPVGAANVSAGTGAGPIFVGNYPNRPVLVDLDGTSAVTIQGVTATYQRFQ